MPEPEGGNAVSSGICRDLSRNWMKFWLAAEREPLPVGIGEGGGSAVVKRPLARIIAMGALDGSQLNRRAISNQW